MKTNDDEGKQALQFMRQLVALQVKEKPQAQVPKPSSTTAIERPKPRGTIYPRGRRGLLTAKFYLNGKAHYLATKTTDAKKAQRLLDAQFAKIENGTFVPPKNEKVKVDALYKLLETDYKMNGHRSLVEMQRNWALHLGPHFGHLRASEVTMELISQYIVTRQAEGAKNATVNNEVANLSRMFHLGQDLGKIRLIPKFKRLKVRNARSGFLEDAQYARLAVACAKRGLWLRALFETAYQFGWRCHELIPQDHRDRKKPGLRVRDIDLPARTLKLDPGIAKNDDARLVEIPEPLFTLLQQCAIGKQPDDYLFTRDDGKPVRDFRGMWKAAKAEAGVSKVLFHDCRRTAVRNMDRNGIPRTVAKKMCGHKTDAIYERYRIVSRQDLRDARHKMEQGSSEGSSYKSSYIRPTDGANAEVANQDAVHYSN